MMEINKTSNKRITTNPEGSVVKDRSPEMQLYLEATNLNLKKNTFYQSDSEKLKSFIEIAEKNDPKYILGLAKFCADNGLKLSPVILLSILSSRRWGFKLENVNYVFNTPQRIAEALSLGLKLNNSFKKNVLKKSLQNMSEYTLTKNLMKRKKIKTRDLIKLLRPKPANENMAHLYKAIIEGKAKFKGESLVRAKSDTELSNEKKISYYAENVDKVGINELIRNLKFIEDHADFKQNNELQAKIHNRLSSITNYRFLNVFDLIEVALQVKIFEKLMFDIVKKFCDSVRAQFKYEDKLTILFDRSGSMSGDGVRNGFKYLVLFSLMFDSKLRFFGSELWKKNGSRVISNIHAGHLKEAYEELCHCPGWTALINSTKQLLAEEEVNTLLVISDEVSWAEGENLSNKIKELGNLLNGRKVIVVNPAIYKGTVFQDNVMAFASLTSSVVYNVSAFMNPSKFIEAIKDYGRS